jgi:hypothetical protein
MNTKEDVIKTLNSMKVKENSNTENGPGMVVIVLAIIALIYLFIK